MKTQQITLISTVYKEIGKCNSIELCKIIESLNPDVIFLEAFENSYSQHQHMLFSQFGVYQERLEIKALQIYNQYYKFNYVPVLDVGLSDEFEKRISIVSENIDFQKILNKYASLETEHGFQFLNSKMQIELQEEMREMENKIIANKALLQKANEGIDAYEHSMLRNIYSYSKQNTFNKAIFMCGAGHRKTITQKIYEYRKIESQGPLWTFYGDTD